MLFTSAVAWRMHAGLGDVKRGAASMRRAFFAPTTLLRRAAAMAGCSFAACVPWTLDDHIWYDHSGRRQRWYQEDTERMTVGGTWFWMK